MKQLGFTLLLTSVFVSALSGCGNSSSSIGGTSTGNPVVADISATGAVASAVGGALSNSSANGTNFVQASQASTHPMSKVQDEAVQFSSYVICPTFATLNGNGCTSNGGTSMWLTYSSCHFSNSTAAINGYQLLSMPSSSQTATCGTFPDPSAGSSSGTLLRQYVTTASGTTPGSLTRTDDDGKVYTIDDSQTNLSNFDNAPITTIANGGYGASVSFNSVGARTGLTIGHQLTSTAMDHSVTGTLTVSEVNRNSTTRTLSGSVTVYHNRVKVIGTSTFTNVTHSNNCCLPISGTISTSFARGSASPTVAGLLLVGKSETLQFTGCGTGTLTSADGTVSTVSMNRCF